MGGEYGVMEAAIGFAPLAFLGLLLFYGVSQFAVA